MISVIIPVRNDEKNLSILLRQIRELNNPKDYEIIVVDGYSTDRSREVAKKYGCKVVLQDKKLGVANAKNVGVKYAKSDVILFLEADHRIKGKNIFKKLEQTFRKKKLEAATVFIWPLIPKRLTPIQRFLVSEIKSGFHFLKASKKLSKSTTISMIRKDAFLKIGGYNEALGYGEDQELAIRARTNLKKVGVIKRSGIYCEPILSVKRLIIQAMWYGRNLVDYIAKTRDFLKLFWILSNVAFYPSLILLFFANVSILLKFLLLLIALPPIFRMFLVSTKSGLVIDSLLAMNVKILRAYGEVLGIISKIFIKHKGR